MNIESRREQGHLQISDYFESGDVILKYFQVHCSPKKYLGDFWDGLTFRVLFVGQLTSVDRILLRRIVRMEGHSSKISITT